MDTDKKILKKFSNTMNNVDTSRHKIEVSVEELFGTLQHSVLATWRKHLRSAKYSKHMALDEFYKKMPDLVDNLIEVWMGVKGHKIDSFTNIIQSKNLNTIKYLKELRSITKAGYKLMEEDPELCACMDDIMSLIDSTLYKVKELSESEIIDLKDFINEALISEAKLNDKKAYDIIKDMYDEENHIVAVASCWNWWRSANFEKYTAGGYADHILEINDDVDEDMAESYYGKCMVAMAHLGKDKTLEFIKKIAPKDQIEDYLDLD